MRDQRSKEDDPGICKSGIGPYFGGDITPIFAGHFHVEENEIGTKGSHDARGCEGTILGPDFVQSAFFQNRRNQPGDVRIIVNNEDAGLCHEALSAQNACHVR